MSKLLKIGNKSPKGVAFPPKTDSFGFYNPSSSYVRHIIGEVVEPKPANYVGSYAVFGLEQYARVYEDVGSTNYDSLTLHASGIFSAVGRTVQFLTRDLRQVWVKTVTELSGGLANETLSNLVVNGEYGYVVVRGVSSSGVYLLKVSTDGREVNCTILDNMSGISQGNRGIENIIADDTGIYAKRTPSTEEGGVVTKITFSGEHLWTTSPQQVLTGSFRLNLLLNTTAAGKVLTVSTGRGKIEIDKGTGAVLSELTATPINNGHTHVMLYGKWYKYIPSSSFVEVSSVDFSEVSHLFRAEEIVGSGNPSLSLFKEIGGGNVMVGSGGRFSIFNLEDRSVRFFSDTALNQGTLINGSAYAEGVVYLQFEDKICALSEELKVKGYRVAL